MDELQQAMTSLPAPGAGEEAEPAAVRLVTGESLPEALPAGGGAAAERKRSPFLAALRTIQQLEEDEA